MSRWSVREPSLLWRMLLVTFAATAVLFSATAYFIARYAIRETEQSVQEEAEASLQEFRFIWRTRADDLASISRLLSSMSDVRGAFQTRDPATIRDTASDLWSRVSKQDAVFLVFDPLGRQIASLGKSAGPFASMERVVAEATRRFPNQGAGFILEGHQLFYMILTPVYVDSSSGSALLNILVTGFEMNRRFAQSLAAVTQGTDFVFTAGRLVVASTLAGSHDPPAVVRRDSSLARVSIRGTDFASLTDPLLDISGRPVGQLSVLRSLAASERRLHQLKTRIALIVSAAIVAALLMSYFLSRHVIDPLHRLDQAAAEVTRRNYGYRLAIDRDDELGRLARTFNSMCDSIQAARQDLIAQERLTTIGRLSSSLIHDLRNPLAAIYGGSEMLIDHENLPPQQSKRLAMSIYRASRHIQDMLRDLADSSRRKSEPIEICSLFEIADAARTLLAPAAESQGTTIDISVAPHFELPLERPRMERVFLNLLSNALEATRGRGEIRMTAREENGSCLIEIDDSGVGISEEVRKQLFQPFFSYGKRNGLGLGLALSRQTVLDHGGELWVADKKGPGARFCIRLPMVSVSVDREMSKAV